MQITTGYSEPKDTMTRMVDLRANAAISLEVKNLMVTFGGVVALDQVSFTIPEGKIVALIGPNGAGKTTLFNCVSRLYTPYSGDILYRGKSLLAIPPHRIVHWGIGRTFQNVALFQNLSVADNIRVGAHIRTRGNLFADALRMPLSRKANTESNEVAAHLMNYLNLDSVALIKVKDLPFGTQKRVELARALATEPSLLLLDEPACGLNHEEVAELGQIIQRIRADFSLTVMLVEHHMGLVMSISDHIVALNFGRRIAEGTPEAVQSHPDVIEAYLGGEPV
jgi:branched-chain amino acid transport system ATP-binding protein